MFWVWRTNFRSDDFTLFFVTEVNSTIYAQFQELTNLL